jgi:hypothetical protein
MVYIAQKNNRRYRLQFTISRRLYERYEWYLSYAKTNQLVIDFSHDFEDWLRDQLNQVGQELNSLEFKSSWPEPSCIAGQQGSSSTFDEPNEPHTCPQGE